MSSWRFGLVAVRHNTVNFFMRRTGRELWKTITSVSKAGQKKGRRSTRQPIRPLENFYRIGSSPLKIRYPGLNAPIRTEEEPEPMTVVEQTAEEVKDQVDFIHTRLEEKGKTKKRRIKEKLYPLERGFSGPFVVGQKLGPPPSVDGVSFEDFETYCLEVKRTSHMTRVFGRVHTMSALVVTGNGNGLAGYAVGKAGIHRSMNAIAKGMSSASRKLFYVERLEDRTIYQDFYAECRNTRIFAQRRPKGFGLVCHPRLIKICEAIGIKDLYAKVEGNTKNYLALTHAFVTGLLNQETHEQLAERTRLHVVEMSPNRNYLPEIVASPLKESVKQDEEMLPIEKLSLDDFYGEGRQPLYKEKPKPFYANTPGHLAAIWRKHPYRNHDQVMIRLMADDHVDRWTRSSRHAWAKHQDTLAQTGVIPIPVGIGLTRVVPKSED
ncbi:S5 DRBM domain-containing protein [Aphelenchoides besseyi]|nr:S5 DRBM domain-containing protein [Aphelenchoides besseyi]KAI6237217.1 S5 DRBM domain-containing protein [Aphelenchoides besseyi]